MTKYTEAEMLDIDELETIIADGARFRLLLDDEAQTENVLSCSHLTDIMEAAIVEHDRKEAAETPTVSAIGAKLAKIGKRKPAAKRKPAKKRKAAPVYSSKLRIVKPNTVGALKNWNGTLVEGNVSSKTIAIEVFRSENGGEPILCGRKLYTASMLVSIVNLDADDSQTLVDICNAK